MVRHPEAMSDTPGRLLKLLSLLQTPREWPGGELAERLDVSPRTIRRDIDRLRDLGYPVEASRGSIGGYRLVAGAAMPPLLLDDEEAVAIAVGLRAGRGTRSRASTRPPYGRWRSWNRCCPPGCGTGSPSSRTPRFR
ncbi:HTH domain-containing protein [Streptomyces sp. Termitarium-T10T-6]|nr:HTH domain-containing protein [Streptomyces sp. Termitarium-T10T-6]